MKKLTLNEAWRLCLNQWRWIISYKRKHPRSRKNPQTLKAIWIDRHGYEENEVQNNCFFCEYDDQHKDDCENCPGRKVDKDFYCSNEEYSWYRKPKQFYKKLLSLNRKRKK